MAYWLLKTEPSVYAFSDLERLGKDMWEGVRNAVAQKHLREIRQGDMAFIYHTGDERAIVGIARVVSDPYPDPTAPSPKLVTVDVEPVRRLERPVALAEIKKEPAFADWELVRIARLSVMPVPPVIWDKILAMARP